jgi:hypothetical protein
MEEVKGHVLVILDAATANLGYDAERDRQLTLAMDSLSELVRNLFYQLRDATEKIAELNGCVLSLTTHIEADRNLKKAIEGTGFYLFHMHIDSTFFTLKCAFFK